MTNATKRVGHVLNGKTREIATHFEDLHPSLDRIWFATILAKETTLGEEETVDAMRAAYSRCKESFHPDARTKVHAPTVVATRHIDAALTAATAAKEFDL